MVEMKTGLLILISCCIFSCVESTAKKVNESAQFSIIYWEDLSNDEKTRILSLHEVYPNAIRYYTGKFKLTDSDSTFILMDVLTKFEKDEEISAFYFHIFNLICLRSDGSLSDAMGKYCLQMIQGRPNYVLEYFSYNNQLMSIYAMYIGEVFFYEEAKMSEISCDYGTFKDKLITDTQQEYNQRETLVQFLDSIERVMREMD